MTLSSGTSTVFVRFRQRSDPLVIIELFRGWALFLLQEHELRVEENSALFRQVSCRPLFVRMSSTRNKRLLWPAPAKETIASEMFLPLTCGLQSTHGRQFDVRERLDTCLAAALLCSLIALRAAWYLPPSQAIRAAAALSALVG